MIWERELAAGNEDSVVGARVEKDDAGQADAQIAGGWGELSLDGCEHACKQWYGAKNGEVYWAEELEVGRHAGSERPQQHALRLCFGGYGCR